MKNNLSKLSNYLTLNGLFSEAAMIKTAGTTTEDINASFEGLADAVRPGGILQTIKEYLTTNDREYLERMLLTSTAAYLKDFKNENDKKYIINHIAKQKFKQGVNYKENVEAQKYVANLTEWILKCIEVAEKIEEISAVIGAGAEESISDASYGKGAVTRGGKEKSKSKAKAKGGKGAVAPESGGKGGVDKGRRKEKGKGGKESKG